MYCNGRIITAEELVKWDLNAMRQEPPKLDGYYKPSGYPKPINWKRIFRIASVTLFVMLIIASIAMNMTVDAAMNGDFYG